MTEVVNAVIDVAPLVTELTTAATPAAIVTLLATAVAAGVPLALVWFGSRKVVSVFQMALKKGKLRI